ncbi:putative OmpL-like beta-barrel porin-2 [Algoriphagus boseongensis]|uniref:Putative OmpL-like beta-barrel porin-2 n=1 Tax=Algoriphagus boseongensis TaxID=1442587 RepID=A0A4R6T3I4_9BACT|nr:porin [Algoriphagus boseongensis]TDQ16991.1 putative OmpL-like beta-barrel porin-2 [Algoriphagus boseongensis]
MKKSRFSNFCIVLFWGAAFVFFCTKSQAQIEERKPSPFQFSGFLNLYYGYDFNEPSSSQRLPFLYNHTRHNRPAVNLALVSGSYQADRFRANLGIHAGTYPEDNYANEPKALQFIHQANLGIALDKEQTLWLDAGVLPSHIGFESAVSKEDLTLSRSLIAENSPYFETGAKLGWQANGKWYLAFLYLNGWQRIRPIPGKNKPSFGTQATYTPSDRTLWNWSTFLGTDQSLEAGTSIFFSNLYGTFSVGERWKLIAGLDVGKRVNQDLGNQTWWGAAFLAQYSFSEKFSSALRLEHYSDPFQGITFLYGQVGLEASGVSLNLDQKIGDWGLLRVEGRYLDSPQSFYPSAIQNASSNFFFLSSFSVFWN